MRDSTCSMGMFTAPGICPKANSAAERTSTVWMPYKPNIVRRLAASIVWVILPSIWEERRLGEKDSGSGEIIGRLLLVDDLPCPDGVTHLGEAAEINRGVGVEDDQVRVVTFDHFAGLARLEERRGIGGERGQNVAPVHSRATHVFVLAGGVVELSVAHVGAEENRAATREVAL